VCTPHRICPGVHTQQQQQQPLPRLRQQQQQHYQKSRDFVVVISYKYWRFEVGVHAAAAAAWLHIAILTVCYDTHDDTVKNTTHNNEQRTEAQRCYQDNNSDQHGGTTTTTAASRHFWNGIASLEDPDFSWRETPAFVINGIRITHGPWTRRSFQLHLFDVLDNDVDRGEHDSYEECKTQTRLMSTIATNLAAAKNWTRLDDSQDENNTTSFWNKATNFSQIVPHFSASCADVFFLRVPSLVLFGIFSLACVLATTQHTMSNSTTLSPWLLKLAWANPLLQSRCWSWNILPRWFAYYDKASTVGRARIVNPDQAKKAVGMLLNKSNWHESKIHESGSWRVHETKALLQRL
jgi:hypothetical protein